MGTNPYQVVRDFEAAVCEYTGAPYCVAVNSCTSALFLALKLCFSKDARPAEKRKVTIPSRTYISVPMQIIHAGGSVRFEDVAWRGAYLLNPYPIWDSARRFRRDMYRLPWKWNTEKVEPSPYNDNEMVCVSFQATKTLGDTQGGAILLSEDEDAAWLRRARFDGRTEGVAPKDDKFTMLGWHMYMSPDVAARLNLKLRSLPDVIPDFPNDDYPDLSQLDIFK
jgi:dTDP-4-amino-4,6-dideoxygalactose transaminase